MAPLRKLLELFPAIVEFVTVRLLPGPLKIPLASAADVFSVIAESKMLTLVADTMQIPPTVSIAWFDDTVEPVMVSEDPSMK
jgi:hypothetical protein